LRLRLIVSILALLVPAAAAAGWLLVQVFANRLQRDIDVALEEEAETVAALMAKPGAVESGTSLLGSIAAETDLGPGKLLVVTRNGQIVSEIPPGAQAALRSGDPAVRSVSHQAGATSDGVVVTVAVRADAAQHARQRLTVLLLAGLPAGVLVLSAGLWMAIGQALRPLEETSRQLDTLAVDSLSVRVRVTHPDDEVGRLVKVLNRMLDRVEDNVAQLQRFTAHAAHELRTPLAVLRTGIDLALSRQRSAADYRAALSEALASTERLCRLAEDLLTLARLEALRAVRPTANVDLAEMLHELGDAWAQVAAGRGVKVAVEAVGPLEVSGNAADLYRLFNNLLDNAMRYSPEGSTLQLAARRQGAQVEVTVCDAGAGIAGEDVARVFEPFYRGTGIRSDQPGAGLGLSIAKEITRTHGGQISIANRDVGGCMVEVALPASSG
jgi:signal transduction histidine kinase